MIFSETGVDMAGWQCDWKAMVWFGGKKTMKGKDIMPCWVAKGIDENYEFTLQIFTIKPVSEKLFKTICQEVHNRFSDQITHLSELSWKLLRFDRDDDLPFHYGTQVLLVPAKKQQLGESDIFTEKMLE
jgi:hypothetical protein